LGGLWEGIFRFSMQKVGKVFVKKFENRKPYSTKKERRFRQKNGTIF
jgi:hypothetical protein